MSFPKYPHQKQSGVPWLGEIPAEWQVVALSRMLAAIESGTSVNAVDIPADADEFGVLKTSCVYTGEFRSEENKRVVIDEYGRLTCPLRRGALIVSRMNTPDLVGAAGLVNDAPANLYLPDRLWQVSFATASPKFMHYWTQTCEYREQVRSACTGTSASMKNLSQVQFRNFLLARPSLFEQAGIAAFLDRETSKIDALVAEQRRLIELLKEKRQAVISHAVTKGLNPEVRMKPSGVPWIGDVPEHWAIGTKLKALALPQPASFTNGPFGSDLLTSELQDEGVPVIYIRDLRSTGYSRTSSSFVTDEKAKDLDKFRVDPGDVLMAKVGDPPGFCCTYPLGEPAGIICQDVIRIKLDVRVTSAEFLCHLLNSGPGVESINSVCVELTRKRFSLADLQSLRFPLPPIEEQNAIVLALSVMLEEVTSLLTSSERAIDLLQERRTALISAAVTGKIDVRHLAESEAA